MQGPHVPIRRCLGCGHRMEKRALVRFVAAPEGDGYRLVRDRDGRLPGRGLYLCDHRACFVRAAERRAFHRGARIGAAPLEVDAALADELRPDGTVNDGHD